MSKPGILLLGNVPPARMVELARLAESAGYGDAWVADERFYREAYSYLAMIAGNTTSIHLGTLVTDPYSRHPAMTAAAVSTLDEISGGRAMFGIGAGLSGFGEMGVERRKPVTAMREAIELVRLLMAGGTVDYQGETTSFKSGRLNFEPIRARVPVYLASNGPLGQVLAGKVADAAVMEGCGSVPEAELFVAKVRGAAQAAGRDPASVKCIARLNCCIAEDSAVAHDTLRLRAARTLGGSVTGSATLVEQGLALPPEALKPLEGIPYNSGLAPYEVLLPLVTDRMMEAVTLAGTAGEVTAQVARLRKAGIDSVIIAPAAAPGGSIDEIIKRFAGEIWPASAPV